MKYSRTLDLVLASLREAKAGKVETAATLFQKAITQKDFDVTVAALERRQTKAFEEITAKNPTVASLFDAVVAKLAGKSEKAKGKTVVKAADEDDLEPVLDDMIAAGEDDGEGTSVAEPDDLSLEDLEDLDGDDTDDVLEMPQASTASEDSDDEDEEDKDDKKEDKDEKEEDAKPKKAKAEAEDDEADDAKEDDDEADDEEEAKPKKAKASAVVKANLAALDRLVKSKKSK